MSVLDDFEEWQAHRRVEAELVDKEAKLRREVAQLKADHEAASAEWLVALEAAKEKGKPLPEPPEKLNARHYDEALVEVQQAQRAHRESAKQVLASLYPSVKEVVGSLFDEARPEAERLTAEMDALLAVLRPALADLHRVAAAVDSLDPNCRPANGSGLRDRMLSKIGALHLWELARGSDLLALRPLPSRPDTEPHADPAPSMPLVRRGLVPESGAFGRPPPPSVGTRTRTGEI